MTGSMWSLKRNQEIVRNSSANQYSACHSLVSGESGASYGFSAITIFHAVIEKKEKSAN